MTRIPGLLPMLVAFGLALSRVPAPSPAAFDIVSRRSTTAAGEPVFESRFVSTGVTPSVHSATAVELPRGRLRAFWYGGSREGAKDVAIYTSVLGRASGDWSPEAIVTTRAATARDVGRYIKKLGNPVVTRGRDGRLWLFYVSVSVGGWSGSALNYRTSDDDGESWSRARRLVTSPFINISTLVRGPAVLHVDATLGVPAYHELIGKFGEYLRLAPDGRVIDKVRMSSGVSSLQPVVVPLDAARAVGFMRSSGSSPKRVLSVETSDGGSSFGPLRPTELFNPDAAIAAVALTSGELVMAFNDSERDRSNLSVAISDDEGASWERVHQLEPPAADGDALPRFAYPWLMESSDGQLHLLYTWNRERIVHVRFNRAWLRRNR